MCNDKHSIEKQAAFAAEMSSQMTTHFWDVTGEQNKDQLAVRLTEAAQLLQQGSTIAFPTETVYGLGADARNTEAVEAVFAAKGRPSDNPLIVHIASKEQLDDFTGPINTLSHTLMDKFWPGPLTIIVPLKKDSLSEKVSAGLDTVGVRMPDHPVALELIAAANCPVAAPSANRSGRPSPTTASHVAKDLTGRIAGIVDGGPTGVGVESTVVQAHDDGTITILRPGGITVEQLAEVASKVQLDPALSVDTSLSETTTLAPRSPGMKYTHYAPKGKLSLVQGEPEAVAAYINGALEDMAQTGERTAVLAFSEHLHLYRADAVYSLGSLNCLTEGAQRLYAALRSCDDIGATVLYAEACPRDGLGEAIMNRLLKAAGHRVIHIT